MDNTHQLVNQNKQLKARLDEEVSNREEEAKNFEDKIKQLESQNRELQEPL